MSTSADIRYFTLPAHLHAYMNGELFPLIREIIGQNPGALEDMDQSIEDIYHHIQTQRPNYYSHLVPDIQQAYAPIAQGYFALWLNYEDTTQYRLIVPFTKSSNRNLKMVQFAFDLEGRLIELNENDIVINLPIQHHLFDDHDSEEALLASRFSELGLEPERRPYHVALTRYTHILRDGVIRATEPGYYHVGDLLTYGPITVTTTTPQGLQAFGTYPPLYHGDTVQGITLDGGNYPVVIEGDTLSIRVPTTVDGEQILRQIPVLVDGVFQGVESPTQSLRHREDQRPVFDDLQALMEDRRKYMEFDLVFYESEALALHALRQNLVHTIAPNLGKGATPQGQQWVGTRFLDLEDFDDQYHTFLNTNE